MEDEFLTYLRERVDDRLISSFENVDLLLWGIRDSGDVRLLGLTLTIGVSGLATMEAGELDLLARKVDFVSQPALLLSQRSRSTFFTILYSLSGESLFRVAEPKRPLSLSGSLKILENDMPSVIQSYFGTNAGSSGTAKPVNKSTSDWFHIWTRANLPTEYVKANIDGLLLTADEDPTILLETKRSFTKPRVWKPYSEDGRNYYLQNVLAKRAGIRFWTIYHEKGVTVKDDSEISLFVITDVALESESWITYQRSDTKASEVLGMI